jgi:hypothetical protein
VSKNKKSSQRQSQHETFHNHYVEPQRPRYPVAVPEVINMDILAGMMDEDVYGRLNALEADRVKVVESRLDARPWEEEIAYIRREIQLRRGRREAHEAFIREQARLFAEEERDLPAADFDNLKFVMVYR